MGYPSILVRANASSQSPTSSKGRGYIEVLFYFLLLAFYKEGAGIDSNSMFSQSLDQSINESTSSKNTDSLTKTENYYTPLKHDHRKNHWQENVQLNWTNEEVTNLLQQHGYPVKKTSDGWPLGMLGDIAYHPKDLLPEMGMLHNRRNLISTDHLWIDGEKDTVIPYYYDTESKADQKIFEAAVKTWSDSTCIKFKKLEPNVCSADLGHSAVCVGNFKGCWSSLGRNRDKPSQKMSVEPDGCEMVAAAHEFGHALGLMHEMCRPDRDKYIFVLNINFDFDPDEDAEKTLRTNEYQGGKCSADQMFDAPKPYDSMSLMQYGTYDLNQDCRPTFLHKDVHYQYMFDYHRNGGYAQTHYDKLVTNMGYQCTTKWRKHCQDIGKSVPKCQNYGYATKNCKCACPAGFSGSSCNTKDGPMFPVMDRARAMLDISKPGLIDMKGKGMHDKNLNYPDPDFVLWQFITVAIRSGDETRISSEVVQNFKNIHKYYEPNIDSFITGIDINDCEVGVAVLIGCSELGRMRAECISSLVNNELPEFRPILRSKNNSLDIVGKAGWGANLNQDPGVTRMVMEFQFKVSFLEKPEDKLRVEPKNKGSGTVVESAGSAMKHLLGTGGSKAAILIGVVVSICLIAAAAAFAFWLKKKKDDDEADDKPSTSDSGSMHSLNDDSSDKSEPSHANSDTNNDNETEHQAAEQPQLPD